VKKKERKKEKKKERKKERNMRTIFFAAFLNCILWKAKKSDGVWKA